MLKAIGNNVEYDSRLSDGASRTTIGRQRLLPSGMRKFCELLRACLEPQIAWVQVASKGAEPFEPGHASLQGPRGNCVQTERTWLDADRLPLAAVALESPCRNHCNKSSAICDVNL